MAGPAPGSFPDVRRTTRWVAIALLALALGGSHAGSDPATRRGSLDGEEIGPAQALRVLAVGGPLACRQGGPARFHVHVENLGDEPLVLDSLRLFARGSAGAAEACAMREPAELPMTLAPGELATVEVVADVSPAAASGLVVVDAAAYARAAAARVWDLGADTTLTVSIAPGAPRPTGARRALTAQDRQEIRRLHERGLEAFSSGRLDEAEGHWAKVLEIDPRDTRALGWLARAQRKRARAGDALGGTP